MKEGLTQEEAMRVMELNDDQIESVFNARLVDHELKSLNRKIGDDSDGDSELINHVEDTTIRNPEILTQEFQRHEELLRALATLSPREDKVLRMRFGILEERNHTLEQISELYGVTRERIRQIESNGLRKLRKNPETMAVLREFL